MSGTRHQNNKILYLPTSVARDDVINGRLIEQDNINHIILAINSIRDGKDGRYSAAQLNEEFESLDIHLEVNFNFIKHGDQYYALYEPNLEPEDDVIADYEQEPSDDEEVEIIEEYEWISDDENEEEIIEEYIEEYPDDSNYDTEESYEDDTLTMKTNSGFGSVVFAQNIESLEWAAVKSVRESNEVTETYFERTEEIDLETGETVLINEETHVDLTQHDEYVDIETRGLDTVGQLLGHVRNINEEGKVQDEIVMKLAQGVELADFVMAREMPAIKWIDLAIAVMESAIILSKMGILHRDYKPENLFYDAAADIVTPVDFGMAREYDHDHSFKSHIYEGTPDFSAPELSPYEEQEEYIYTEQTEMYALGATLAEILGIKDLVVTKNEISYDAADFESRIDNPIAKKMLDSLITRTLSWKAKERPSLQKVLNELKVIREQHLDLRSKIVKLAYLNIDEFKSLDDTHKGEMIAALRSADEVQLYAGRSKPNEWVDIKHELENSGICVDNTVVLPGRGIMNALDANTAEREKSSDKIYNAFYVASPARKNQQSFGSVTVVVADPVARAKSRDETHYYPSLIKTSIDPVKLRPGHVDKVINSISDQIKLLKDHDYDHPQIEKLERFLTAFKESGPNTTYKMLFDSMSKLEKSMKQSIAAQKHDAKKTVHPNTLFAKKAHKAVKEVRKEIEKDVGIRKK